MYKEKGMATSREHSEKRRPPRFMYKAAIKFTEPHICILISRYIREMIQKTRPCGKSESALMGLRFEYITTWRFCCRTAALRCIHNMNLIYSQLLPSISVDPVGGSPSADEKLGEKGSV